MSWFKNILRLLGIEKGLVNVTAGNVISSLIGVAFWLFLASIMTVEDYGKLNYYLSIAMTASALALMGLNVTVMTYLPKGDDIIKHQANLLILIANCVICAILFLLTRNIPVIIMLFGLSFFTMAQAEILGRSNFKKYSYVVIGQRVLLVPISLSLYYVMGVDGVITGYGLSTLLFSYNFFKSLKRSKLQLKDLKPKFRFTLHAFSINVLEKVTFYVDKLLIGPLFGFGVLGTYQFGFQFLMFLYIIPYSLYQFLLPRESVGISGGRILITGMVAAIIFSAASFVLIPSIVNSFFTHFVGSVQSAQIMVFGVIPLMASNIIIARFFGKGKSTPPLIASVIRVIALLPLIFFLGNLFSTTGLAFAILISLVTQFVTLFILTKISHDKKKYDVH
jgi:O-antigen/teichoic acid export membrane protein